MKKISPNNEYIVSTTYLRGMITSVNDTFINIIRYPDIPAAAFADLWQTIKTGKAWMGIIKNYLNLRSAGCRN